MTTIEHAGGRIAYADDGAGEPVIMLHCSSASRSEWTGLAEVLQGDHRTIATDQWGCGASDAWPGRRAFSLAEEAAPILAMLERIGRPAHLVGHSYGGAVALHIARKAPRRLASLTLVEPSSFHILRLDPREQVRFAEIAMVADAAARAMRAGDLWSGMGWFVDYWSGDGAWAALPETTKASMAPRLSKVLLDFTALFDEPCGVDQCAAIDAPTLILCGEHSPAPSRRIVEMLACAIRGARVARIPGAGHMSPLTHAGPVNAAIAAHVRLWRKSQSNSSSCIEAQAIAASGLEAFRYAAG